MDIKKLQAIILNVLENMKAQDVHVYNTTHLTSLFDQVTIASGTSSRHTKALASSICDEVKGNTGVIPRVEGDDTGEWVLVDTGYIVVHIMQPTIRAYYHLEEIWGYGDINTDNKEQVLSCAVDR
jgi:ribosome-associated protein